MSTNLKRGLSSAAAFVGILLVLCSSGDRVEALDSVTLQLKWRHQFQFAGFYAAIERGYYREAGFDVTLREGTPQMDFVEELTSGRADYVVTGPGALIERANGKQIVAIAAIFQHSPVILLARKQSEIHSPADLIGKRIMYVPATDPEFLGMCRNEGIELKDIVRLPHSWSADSLVRNETDAMTAYITNEPYYLQQIGFPYSYLRPLTYGIDFYGDCLYTSEGEVKRHRARVNAFLQASLRGWEYAMANEEEILDLLLTKYGVKKDRDSLRYEAEKMRELILPLLVPLGHMNPGRWKHILDTYVKLGMVDKEFKLGSFVYDPSERPEAVYFKWALIAALLIASTVGAGALVLLVFNRRLSRSVHERTAELDDHKTRLQLSLHAARAGTWIWEAQSGRFIFDDRMHQILDLTPDQSPVTFETWKEFVHPEDLRGVEAAMQTALKDGGRFEIEYRVKHRDGQWRVVNAQADVFMDENNQPLRIAGIALDITERKMAEERVRKAHALLNAVMEGTTDAIFLKDMEGRYMMVNSATCDAIGKPAEEVIGKDDRTLFPQSSFQVISAIDSEVLKTGKTVLAEEKLQTAHGETYWLTNKSPHFDAAGNIVGLIGISRNITDLKDSEKEKEALHAQLRQARKMEAIGTLAGGIAHDFNNILNIIMGNTDLALYAVPDSEPLRRDLLEIKTACSRAKDIIRQLLNFSRKVEHERRPIRIQPIVEESIRLLRASIPVTVDIRLNMQEHVGNIKADPPQIHQVILNLCTNAAHAMEVSGGVLQVGLDEVEIVTALTGKQHEIKPGRYVQLTISDTGVGISRENQERIFDPYFTTKAIGKGTGMGLSVAHGIVKSHEGAITVESEPDKGTTFKVLFPVIYEEALPDECAPEEPPKGNERILFVDDERSIAYSTRAILERYGYAVSIETDPLKALEVLRSNPGGHDLIITDMTMPGLRGDDFARQVLEIRPDIPIILCTGFSEKIDEDICRKMGIRKYLEKPVEGSELAKAVREVLDAA